MVTYLDLKYHAFHIFVSTGKNRIIPIGSSFRLRYSVGKTVVIKGVGRALKVKVLKLKKKLGSESIRI